jgi:hypothetical protein
MTCGTISIIPAVKGSDALSGDTAIRQLTTFPESRVNLYRHWRPRHADPVREGAGYGTDRWHGYRFCFRDVGRVVRIPVSSFA